MISNISFRSRDIQVFKICKLAKWWRHTFNQILFKYDEKRYLSQFVSEMFDSLQQDSTKCAPQYKLDSSVTMATYWFQTSPILKAFLATFGVPFWYLLTALHMHDQQAYKYVSSVLRPCLHSSNWKSLIYWNQVGGDWKTTTTTLYSLLYSLHTFKYGEKELN